MPVITGSFIVKIREQGKYQVTSKSMLFDLFYRGNVF